MIAISQADARCQFATQPFAAFPSPPLYPKSMSPSAVSVDSLNHRIYALDAGPGRIGALELRDDGLHTIWTAPQRTTEFLALIGPSDRRVLVGIELPPASPWAAPPAISSSGATPPPAASSPAPRSR